MLHLTGGTTALATAFGVTRIHCTVGTTAWDSYAGRISLPIELASAVNGVYGFDTRPEAYRGQEDEGVVAPATVAESYTAVEIADLYAFPRGRDGRGNRSA